MNTYEAIKLGLDGAHHVFTAYLSDLSDSDLLVRPVPGANHSAWQIGHVLCSEYKAMESLRPGASAKLPAGFAESHSKETANIDDAKKFQAKSLYLDLWNKQRRATLGILETFKESELDKPGPESMRSYAPTIGSVFVMCGNHQMMHAGQFVVVRRKLGKPVLF